MMVMICAFHFCTKEFSVQKIVLKLNGNDDWVGGVQYFFSGQNIFSIICIKHFRNRTVFNHKGKCKMHTIKCTCSRSNVIKRLFFTYIGLELFQYMSGNLLIPLERVWDGTLFWTECTNTVLVNKRLDCTTNAVIVKTIGWRSKPERHIVLQP